MAFGPRRLDTPARLYWASVPAPERRRLGLRMRRQKGALHGLRTRALRGDFLFMRLCWKYIRSLGRKLTPADYVWIRAHHAEEIAASAKPLDESKRLAKLSKKQREAELRRRGLISLAPVPIDPRPAQGTPSMILEPLPPGTRR